MLHGQHYPKPANTTAGNNMFVAIYCEHSRADFQAFDNRVINDAKRSLSVPYALNENLNEPVSFIFLEIIVLAL